MPPARRNAPILVADDSEESRLLMVGCLKGAGLGVEGFPTADALLAAIRDDTLVCVLDLHMPGTDGLTCLRQIKQRNPSVEVLMVTVHNVAKEAVEATRAGAFDYMTKPFVLGEFTRTVQKALQLSRSNRESSDLRASVGAAGPTMDLLGSSQPMRQLRERLQRVAATDETVLITGESGTGKTVAARVLHSLGRRALGPFVSVSCPSLPRDLIESELFGHEKGAFSGALQRRLGRVELAEGGTLFLDEVGELPLELQPKLLTFLQERQFYRVGGEQPRKANVRIVAATNQDIGRMSQEGRFRKDLFYRLNVFPLELPPLRVRTEDIRPLAMRFLEKFAERNHCAVPELEPGAWQALSRYAWPGNVREMENMLSHAATLVGPGGAITAASLPLESRTADRPMLRSTLHGMVPGLAGRSLEEVERLALMQTLAACQDNRAEAARLLDVAEKTIYNMMRRHNLLPPADAGKDA